MKVKQMAARIIVITQAICIFGVMVWFHDDGLPKTLSEADQSYVLQQNQVAEDRMRDVVDGMRRFVAEPDRESEMADQLVVALDSWFEVGYKDVNDKRFFVGFDDRIRKQQERFVELNKELDSAVEEMVEELWARKDRGEYDQEAYGRLTKSLMTFDSIDFKLDGVCDKRKCIWCFFQRVIFK